MTDIDQRKIAANYVGALATLLGGRPGRHDLFLERVWVGLVGRPADALQLMPFSRFVAKTGRPVIWVHRNPLSPEVPHIGLVALTNGQTRIFENCMLWLSPNGSRARIIPDSFEWGSYRFDDNLRLRHSAAPPAPSFDAAGPGMIRAYSQLFKLEREQRDRGDTFQLPMLHKAA